MTYSFEQVVGKRLIAELDDAEFNTLMRLRNLKEGQPELWETLANVSRGADSYAHPKYMDDVLYLASEHMVNDKGEVDDLIVAFISAGLPDLPLPTLMQMRRDENSTAPAALLIQVPQHG